MSRPTGPEPSDERPSGEVPSVEEPSDEESRGEEPSVEAGRVATDPVMSPLSDPGFVAGLRPIPSGPIGEAERRPASDIVGVGPDGAPVEVRIGASARPLLVVFLHTRCDGCGEFWSGLADDAAGKVPGSVDAVIVTRGSGAVDADEVGALSTAITQVPVVMSDEVWSAYRVLGYPFFVLVDPVSSTVVGETVGFGWSDVSSMVRASGY
jgi:hypothetical protein